VDEVGVEGKGSEVEKAEGKEGKVNVKKFK
jgi:hypothetical protein